MDRKVTLKQTKLHVDGQLTFEQLDDKAVEGHEYSIEQLRLYAYGEASDAVQKHVRECRLCEERLSNLRVFDPVLNGQDQDRIRVIAEAVQRKRPTTSPDLSVAAGAGTTLLKTAAVIAGAVVGMAEQLNSKRNAHENRERMDHNKKAADRKAAD